MRVSLFRQSLSVHLASIHDVPTVSDRAAFLGETIGLDEDTCSRVKAVVGALASNVVKHAGGGTLILRGLSDNETGPSNRGLEILSLDSGPGMNVSTCLADGYSTTGDAGIGLTEIKTLSTQLDLYSLADRGSVICAQIWKTGAANARFDIGAICLPVQGEQLCGDGWSVRVSKDGLDIVMTDGLGHGIRAAQASDVALAVFAEQVDVAPGPMIQAMHDAMQDTCGAAALAVRLDSRDHRLTCAGVGNIGGIIMATPKPIGIVSLDGVVGDRIRKIREFDYECRPADVLVLHSDGLKTHWSLDEFPGLKTKSASVIAGWLFNHLKRAKDDATILVMRAQ